MTLNFDEACMNFLEDSLKEILHEGYTKETKEFLVELMMYSFKSGWSSAINRMNINA